MAEELSFHIHVDGIDKESGEARKITPEWRHQPLLGATTSTREQKLHVRAPSPSNFSICSEISAEPSMASEAYVVDKNLLDQADFDEYEDSDSSVSDGLLGITHEEMDSDESR